MSAEAFSCFAPIMMGRISQRCTGKVVWQNRGRPTGPGPAEMNFGKKKFCKDRRKNRMGHYKSPWRLPRALFVNGRNERMRTSAPL